MNRLQPTWGLCKCGLTNKHQPIANPGCGSGCKKLWVSILNFIKIFSISIGPGGMLFPNLHKALFVSGNPDAAILTFKLS